MRRRGPREITSIDQCPDCGTKVARKHVFIPNPDTYWFLNKAHYWTQQREKAEAEYEQIVELWRELTTESPYEAARGVINYNRMMEDKAYEELGRWFAGQLHKP